MDLRSIQDVEYELALQEDIRREQKRLLLEEQIKIQEEEEHNDLLQQEEDKVLHLSPKSLRQKRLMMFESHDIKCKAITKRGTRCLNKKMHNRHVCYVHINYHTFKIQN
jgi:hypothetical protein